MYVSPPPKQITKGPSITLQPNNPKNCINPTRIMFYHCSYGSGTLTIYLMALRYGRKRKREKETDFPHILYST